MTGIVECGRCLQRFSMERSLLTEVTSNRNFSRICSIKVFNLFTDLKAKIKNKLMPMWDKIMQRKRYVIECINELLKNKANFVHSRHRSIHNFIMNLCSALTAYCFFENKPEVLPVYVEKSGQLELFA